MRRARIGTIGGALAVALAGCGSSGSGDAGTQAAEACAVPVGSVYLVRSPDRTRTFVRQNVGGGVWSDAGRSCLRQWAVARGYTYIDPE